MLLLDQRRGGGVVAMATWLSARYRQTRSASMLLTKTSLSQFWLVIYSIIFADIMRCHLITYVHLLHEIQYAYLMHLLELIWVHLAYLLELIWYAYLVHLLEQIWHVRLVY